MRIRDVVFLLLVSAVGMWWQAWRPARSGQIGDYPFSIDGVRLGESGAEIQDDWGRPVQQLPRHDKRPGPVLHRHIYQGGSGTVDVEFDDSSFTALNIRGFQLEYLGKPVMRAGDSVQVLERLGRVTESLSEGGPSEVILGVPAGAQLLSYRTPREHSLRSLHVVERNGRLLSFVLNQLY